MVEVVGCFTLACRFSMSNKMGQKVHGVVRRAKCNWLQIALVAFLPCMQAVPTPLPFVYLHYMYLCKESNYRSLSLCRLHYLCLVRPRCCWLHHLCPVWPHCCWLQRLCPVQPRCCCHLCPVRRRCCWSHHLCPVWPCCCWLHHLCPVQPRCCWLHRLCLVRTHCCCHLCPVRPRCCIWRDAGVKSFHHEVSVCWATTQLAWKVWKALCNYM